MKTKTNTVLIPLMLTFFAMGFVDLVGISANYVKADFGLSDTLSNLLPSMVFLWFLVLSVPTGLLMNRIGRKNTVLLSLWVTLPALVLPLINYSFTSMLISFSFLGIGNTLMQVSLNPLIANVVSPHKRASTLTFGQFVKAIASFIAPILAAYAVTQINDWRLFLFPLFGTITLLVIVMLSFTKIKESGIKNKSVTFSQCFSLLRDSYILLLFLGIMAHVGLDVGINTTAPRLLMEKVSLPLSEASFATSWYFIFRTTGCLLGSFFLSKYTSKKVFLISVLMILVGTLGLFISNQYFIYAGIALFGLGNSNIFSVLFSQALKEKPEQNNEVSGLMVTGICGGAVFPLIMGILSDSMGSQNGAIFILLLGSLYFLSFLVKKIKTE